MPSLGYRVRARAGLVRVHRRKSTAVPNGERSGVRVWHAMIRAGVPEQIAGMNAQAFSLTADGDAEWVTQDVPSLLGRPARSFEQFTADYAAAFS